MKYLCPRVVFLMFLKLGVVFANWNVTLVGEAHYPGSSTLCITVGDGNNDGFNEIYTGTWTPFPYDGYTYQFKWDGTNWIRDTLSGKHEYNIMDVTVGDADNNGFNEVYSSAFDFQAGLTKDLYQFIYQDTMWILNDSLGKEGGLQTFIADGDNDGIQELYGIGHQQSWTRVHQYKWNGISWDITVLGDSGENFHSLYVGDGDNDGLNEVYATNTDGNIYYYKWNGSSWSENKIPYEVSWTITFKGGLVIGDADNNGLNEVYCSFSGQESNRLIYRYIWNGTNWTKDSVIYISDEMTNGGLTIGDGDNDGLQELYDINTVGTPGTLGIYKIFWADTVWNYEFIPTGWTSPAGPGTDLALGDGNNDGESELYLSAGGVDGEIYQFKYISTGVKENAECGIRKAELQIYPNPAKGKVRFLLFQRKELRDLRIYNSSGRLIKIFTLPGSVGSSKFLLYWNGVDYKGNVVNTGTYFAKFGSKTVKFLFFR